MLSVILSGHQNLQVIRRVDVEPNWQLALFDTKIRELGHCLGENLVVAPGHILEHRGHWTIEPKQIVAAIAAWSQNYARLGAVKVIIGLSKIIEGHRGQVGADEDDVFIFFGKDR